MMPRALRPALAAVVLLAALPAAQAATWTHPKPDYFLLTDSDDGMTFVSFACVDRQLTVEYSVVAADFAHPIPNNVSVRFNIAVEGEKPASFPVVLEDPYGLIYRLGAADAPAILALAELGKPFTTNLTYDDAVAWKGSFANENLADMKADLTSFCPGSE